jgi:hypothetical protein
MDVWRAQSNTDVSAAAGPLSPLSSASGVSELIPVSFSAIDLPLYDSEQDVWEYPAPLFRDIDATALEVGGQSRLPGSPLGKGLESGSRRGWRLFGQRWRKKRMSRCLGLGPEFPNGGDSDAKGREASKERAIEPQPRAEDGSARWFKPGK